MTTPSRIRRQRTKGWRMPERAVYVGRPTVFGNPFRIDSPYCGPTIQTPRSAGDTVAAFRTWLAMDTLDHRMWDHGLIVAHVAIKAALQRGDIQGRDLACWCPLDQPCHADILLEIANRDAA